MLYRKVSEQFKKWLKESDKALLVTGARQVGKTYLIERVLEEENVYFDTINLIQHREIIPLLDKSIQTSDEQFLIALTNALSKPLRDGMVIFIDEVQMCKEILTVIKFLAKIRKYKFVLSGSLLGVNITNLFSAPVGYLETIEMYPMDFEEFLIANKFRKDQLRTIQKCFENKTQVPETLHIKLINLFYKYLIIGGMPSVVNTYLTTRDLNAVYIEQNSIIQQYKNDFTKYEVLNKKLSLIHIYENIPSELNAKNKRFNFKSLQSTNGRLSRYENNFNWLIDAGAALSTFNVSEPRIPLLSNKKNSLFKFFCSDVGLLTCMYGKETALKLLENGKDINCGAIYENAVAQELKCHNYPLYFYSRKKQGEIDFIIEKDGKVLPIEVKSGKDYYSHSALDYALNEKFAKEAIVLSNFNVQIKDKITYYPIYMVMFIDKTIDFSKKIKF